MQKTNSELKCTVELGAIPMSRLINKNKLTQLKDKFNGKISNKTTNRSLTRLSAMASTKQKESFARAENRRAEIQAAKESKKAEKQTTPND